MVKRSYPIDNLTAVVSMTFLGLLLVFVGLFNQSLLLLFDDLNITGYFLIFASVASFLLVVIELGLKRFSSWSRLKRFTNQQIITLGVACLVVLSSVLVTIFPSLSWLTWFNGGVFVVQGATVILEAFR